MARPSSTSWSITSRSCGSAGNFSEVAPGAVRADIPGTAHAAEDLAAEGGVTVAERSPDGTPAGCRRAPPEHAILVSEEDLRVFRVGEGPISGVGAEPSRGPFPDVAEHVPAAERRDPAWVAADARGAEHLRIQIGARGVGRLVAPRVAALRA